MGPRPQGLGRLSARYESARAGASAIGWDSGGGASYGTFQIATATGTMARFIDWCQTRFPAVHNALAPLQGSAPDTKGAFAAKWRELATGNGVQEAEREFIAQTHYDPAFDRLTDPVKALVQGSRALQDVLWSSAVQHGPGGAGIVFNGSWSPGVSVPSFIVRVYERRSMRLSKLRDNERAAVLNRYAHEQADALRMAQELG